MEVDVTDLQCKIKETLAVFTLETDNPSKTGYPSSTDNPSQCESGTVFILDGYWPFSH